MKALATSLTDLTQTPWPRVRAVADSAIARQREPIWLEGDANTAMCAIVCPCYRIGRLGLNISPKFAARYIDGIGLAAMVLPAIFAPNPLEAPAVLYACNGAMVLGDEVAPEQLESGQWLLKVSRTDVSGAIETYTVTTSGMTFGETAVARLSQLMTFKTGDRVLDTGHSTIITLDKGTHIDGSLQSVPLLHCKAL